MNTWGEILRGLPNAAPRLFVPILNWTKENVDTHSARRPRLSQGLPANECTAE
jgi:hypothetical protein